MLLYSCMFLILSVKENLVLNKLKLLIQIYNGPVASTPTAIELASRCNNNTLKDSPHKNIQVWESE